MTATITGAPWQSLVGYRVELGATGTYTPGGTAYWGTARWGSSRWGAGWDPQWVDVTAEVMDAAWDQGVLGVDQGQGVGRAEITLLDLGAAHAPTEDPADWWVGRFLRIVAVVGDRAPVGLFFGRVDKATAGGTVQAPTVTLLAYDLLSLLAADAVIPVGNQAEDAGVRLEACLAAVDLPPANRDVRPDTTRLLADDTRNVADTFGRALDSTGGLAWSDGAGIVHVRPSAWAYGLSEEVVQAIVVGDPVGVDPAVPWTVPTDLSGSEGLSTVANIVTRANKADPVDSVTVDDPRSRARYGPKSDQVTDLLCDAAMLDVLARTALKLRRSPVPVVDACTVTVYDPASALTVERQPGETVAVVWDVDGGAHWRVLGVVVGVSHTVSSASWDVGLIVANIATLAGGPGRWGSARWGYNRWSAPGGLTFLEELEAAHHG